MGSGKENTAAAAAALARRVLSSRAGVNGEEGAGGGVVLTSPEKRMTVEEWIYHNAGLAEQMLRGECEGMVEAFEREGGRARGVLEGLVVD